MFVQANFSSLSTIHSFGKGNLLPVELVNFMGRLHSNNRAILQWETASESNNKGFEVFKSTEGSDWERIGYVDGNNTSSQKIEYSFLDESVSTGFNYYRLKQIDFDGGFEFSKIIAIENKRTANLVSVYPNPSVGSVSTSIINPDKEKVKITLTNSLGRKLWESGLIEDTMNWHKSFNLEESGCYFLTVQIGSEVLNEKIIIK